jgi:hypothetical protein
MTLRSARPALAVATLVVLTLGLAACGDSSSKDTTTTTKKETTTTAAAQNAQTVLFNEEVQADLKAVGCYEGADDGIIGPETDAAIKAFQEAEGLEVDGEFGPETEAALNKAVEEGKKVCGGTTTTTAGGSTTTTAPAGATCTAASLLTGLPAEGEQIKSYVCADGWAAGTLTDGTTKFILEVDGDKWVAPSQDPCGSASAGLPPVILENGCGS